MQELGGYLTRVRPGTSFSTLEGEPWEDFARLVYAPVSFRDSQSSFGLWSTLSSTGLAFAPPMYSTSETCIEDEDFVAPYVDESYRWAGALDPWVVLRRTRVRCGTGRCNWWAWGWIRGCGEPVDHGRLAWVWWVSGGLGARKTPVAPLTSLFSVRDLGLLGRARGQVGAKLRQQQQQQHGRWL